MIILKFVMVVLVAYLLGAIPFGKMVSRFFANVDITQHGSGNIGGTNVMRTLGLGPAAMVIIGDLGKAFLSVMLARATLGVGWHYYAGFPPHWDYLPVLAEVAAALACMLGHNWSVYIRFKGGKGVAAYFGGWIAMFLLIAGIGALILIPTVVVTRHMSKGSILAALGTMCALMVLTVFFGVSPIYLIYSVIAAVIIVFQHRKNIDRLQRGTELKLDNGVLRGVQSGDNAKEGQ
ncbi:MAG TPA: glycerol-3-phosphate 1-O-acyltransferase PlsY [Dehalococcoidia bacterium]|nr:glycerol-3-phosphate 1-O-acyltransferase PlsY [Dehalococcoidia bacterium]